MWSEVYVVRMALEEIMSSARVCTFLYTHFQPYDTLNPVFESMFKLAPASDRVLELMLINFTRLNQSYRQMTADRLVILQTLFKNHIMQ